MSLNNWNILQINVAYPDGSTGRIVKAIHEYNLAGGCKSSVIYGRGMVVHEDNVYKAAPEWVAKMQSLRARITGYSYGGCWYSTKRIISLIKLIKPDVVHLHCLNGYMVNIYKLLDYLKENSIPTALTLHAEFMYTGGCSYSKDCDQWLEGCCVKTSVCPEQNKLYPPSLYFNRAREAWHMMRDAFSGYDRMVACSVSDWVRHRAAKSVFFKSIPVVTVFNGLDTSVFRPRPTDVLKKQLGVVNKKVILHVTPNFLRPIKGGKHVIEIAKRLEDTTDTVIIVVGFNGNPQDLPENIIPIPLQKDQEALANYYSAADIVLLTSQKETFSMIVAESLCCGTPVVGFQAGAPETIALRDYSEFVEQGNVDKLESSVRKWLSLKIDKGTVAKEASEVYGQHTMCREYGRIYQELMKTSGA